MIFLAVSRSAKKAEKDISNDALGLWLNRNLSFSFSQFEYTYIFTESITAVVTYAAMYYESIALES